MDRTGEFFPILLLLWIILIELVLIDSALLKITIRNQSQDSFHSPVILHLSCDISSRQAVSVKLI